MPDRAEDRRPPRADRPAGRDQSAVLAGVQQLTDGLAVGLTLRRLHDLAGEEALHLLAIAVVGAGEAGPLVGVVGDELVDERRELTGVQRLEAACRGVRGGPMMNEGQIVAIGRPCASASDHASRSAISFE